MPVVEPELEADELPLPVAPEVVPPLVVDPDVEEPDELEVDEFPPLVSPDVVASPEVELLVVVPELVPEAVEATPFVPEPVADDEVDDELAPFDPAGNATSSKAACWVGSQPASAANIPVAIRIALGVTRKRYALRAPGVHRGCRPFDERIPTR